MTNREKYVAREQKIHARMGKYNYSMREIYYENDTWFEYRLGEWYYAWMRDVNELWGKDLGYEALLKYEFGLIVDEATSRGYAFGMLSDLGDAYELCAEFIEGELHSGDAECAAETFYYWKKTLDGGRDEPVIEFSRQWFEYFINRTRDEVRRCFMDMCAED